MSAIISDIRKNSIADDLNLVPGDEIIRINGLKLTDYTDYAKTIQEEELDILVKHPGGEEEIFEIEKDFGEDLGIVFESAVFDKIKPCTNHCIFCFVDGQPEGFRDTLYIKDDDYRLSYLQGSYVTLTNLTDKDRKKIADKRLAPLYVSVHTMNPELRVKMLRNPKAANIEKELDFLKDNFIPFHAQIVLCPGYNDGDELSFTLEKLVKYSSVLLSVAIVPVGVTKYRKDNLKTVDKEIANQTVKIVNEFNKKHGKFPVCVSDEFFLKAEKKIPSKKYYGDFLQIEDGVGAIRLLKDDFKKQIKRFPKKLSKPLKLTFALSKSVYSLFEDFKSEFEKVKNLTVENVEISSEFWGNKITVAGLITSGDLLKSLKDRDISVLVLPGVMFAPYTDKFLDGATISDVKKKLNCEILKIEDYYSVREIADFVLSRE